MQYEKIIVNCDGGSRGNPGPAASAYVISTEDEHIISSKGIFLGHTTNNQAEYEAVIEALKFIQTNISASYIHFKLDSQLVVNQINGTYKVKDQAIKEKYSQVKELMVTLNKSHVTFSYIPRAQNFRADQLVNKTLDEQI